MLIQLLGGKLGEKREREGKRSVERMFLNFLIIQQFDGEWWVLFS